MEPSPWLWAEMMERQQLEVIFTFREFLLGSGRIRMSRCRACRRCFRSGMSEGRGRTRSQVSQGGSGTLEAPLGEWRFQSWEARDSQESLRYKPGTASWSSVSSDRAPTRAGREAHSLYRVNKNTRVCMQTHTHVCTHMPQCAD